MDSCDIGVAEETFIEEGSFDEYVCEGVVGVPEEEDAIARLCGWD